MGCKCREFARRARHSAGVVDPAVGSGSACASGSGAASWPDPLRLAFYLENLDLKAHFQVGSEMFMITEEEGVPSYLRWMLDYYRPELWE